MNPDVSVLGKGALTPATVGPILHVPAITALEKARLTGHARFVVVTNLETFLRSHGRGIIMERS